MKVGVFGGTFDPVHWGHLVLAEEARTVAGLDRIVFVPSAVPPHKRDRALTPWRHRHEMLRLALHDAPGFEVSDAESDPDRPHYTLDTMAEIAASRPGDELHFVLGSDSLLDLPNWRNPAEIVRRWPLVVLARPGFDPAQANPAFTRRMTVIDGLSVAVSSTLVRRRLAAGASVRFLVPRPVLDYARAHALYAEAGG